MDDLDPVDLEEKQRLRLLTAFHNRANFGGWA